jgi:hypothetical protein
LPPWVADETLAFPKDASRRIVFAVAGVVVVFVGPTQLVS